MSYDLHISNINELVSILKKHDVRDALVKKLAKNHNDKQQVYSGSDFRPLQSFFKLEFGERIESISEKKKGEIKGQPILEAVFKNFLWVNCEGMEVPAKNVKMIIYPQYPEARLSGFETINNDIPASMSISFVKENPDVVRYLVLARRGEGECLGFMLLNPSNDFIKQLDDFSNAKKSRVWKHLKIDETSSEKLQKLLSKASEIEHLGCRFKTDGSTIPFNGTQVCGYTLEHECGILPNSDKNGDFEGIELKAHTQSKVTLFTPEPDMGLYSESFESFMKTFGYMKDNGDYRFTGIHRVGATSSKSGLTLTIDNYDPSSSLISQSENDIYVALKDINGNLAAGWSLNRLLNSWDVKHNEVVYVPAKKRECDIPKKKKEGYKYLVSFDKNVMWCKNTSIENLLNAILNGVIFLDPGHKLHNSNPKENKRRSQWRVNSIQRDAKVLYENIETIEL